jgi:hypothetical protein
VEPNILLSYEWGFADHFLWLCPALYFLEYQIWNYCGTKGMIAIMLGTMVKQMGYNAIISHLLLIIKVLGGAKPNWS